MRKCSIAAALMALVLLPSATKASGMAHAASPKLKCAVASIKLVGTSLVATGGCKIGVKSAPAKWSWVQKSADLSGSHCQFGSGKGTSKRSNLLAYPPDVIGGRVMGTLVPGILNASFTVTARWGKQTAKATRSFHKTNPNSRVLCGAPPKLVSLDGPGPSALTWATPPTFDGTVLRAGTIVSRGNRQCQWLKPRFWAQGSYLTHSREFTCANGASGYVSTTVWYSPEGPAKCSIPLQRVSSFVVPPTWGPGYVHMRMTVITWDPSGVQYAYVSNGESPSYNQWYAPDWIEVFGRTDPCEAKLKG